MQVKNFAKDHKLHEAVLKEVDYFITFEKD